MRRDDSESVCRTSCERSIHPGPRRPSQVQCYIERISILCSSPKSASWNIRFRQHLYRLDHMSVLNEHGPVFHAKVGEIAESVRFCNVIFSDFFDPTVHSTNGALG